MFTDKKELRNRLLKARLALSPEDCRERSLQLVDILARHPLVLAADHIALYQSFRNEVDVSSLIDRLPAKAFYFPRTDLEQGTMEFRLFESVDSFERNRWGVLEPSSGDVLDKASPALIIVPGLAFDKRGHRLGYGKGFYDRFLSTHPASTIGVCFTEFFLESLPAEAHDRLVSSVVTEQRSRDVSSPRP